ncbi:hypothetical protein BH23ACT2_BH23ACT2_02380 [soil metagenome]
MGTAGDPGIGVAWWDRCPVGDNGAMASVAIAPKRSGKGFWVGGVLLVVAVVVVVGGIAFGVKQIDDVVGGLARVPVSTGGTVELDRGTHRVFLEGPGADEGFGGVPFTVVGPDGTDLRLQTDPVSETYSYEGRDGRKLGRIEVTSPGTHEVVTGGSGLLGASGENLAFGRRGPVGAGLVPILGGVFGGGALGVAGVVVLIVTGVRRGRQRRMEVAGYAAATWGPPGFAPAAHPYPAGGIAGSWAPPPGPPGGSPPGWSPPPPAGPAPPASRRPPPPSPPSSPLGSPPGWSPPTAPPAQGRTSRPPHPAPPTPPPPSNAPGSHEPPAWRPAPAWSPEPDDSRPRAGDHGEGGRDQ